MKKFLFSNKHSFWQAFVIAFVIFWTGIMLGILFENSRTSKLEKYYFNSETEIFDVQLIGKILFEPLEINCDTALTENINFAERIYEEAKTLEKYDSSNKITEDIVNLHKRYDLLRTMLWKNAIELQENCPGKTNVVVYLYQYIKPSINTQARQITLSKVTLDLKKKYGNKVILIPIAHDTGIKSLNLLKQEYNLDKFPIVIINQEHKFTELTTVIELEQYLNSQPTEKSIDKQNTIILNNNNK